MDASGTADSEGNTVLINDDDISSHVSCPMDDVAWIQRELIQWVFKNLELKWSNVARRGRFKVCIIGTTLYFEIAFTTHLC